MWTRVTSGSRSKLWTLPSPVLNGRYRLTPRVRSLFLIRKARAYAQGGDDQALKLVREARSLYQDGLAATDPAWAWWIDEREISWHEAMCRADLGDHASALRHFETSVQATPAGETRSPVPPSRPPVRGPSHRRMLGACGPNSRGTRTARPAGGLGANPKSHQSNTRTDTEPVTFEAACQSHREGSPTSGFPVG